MCGPCRDAHAGVHPHDRVRSSGDGGLDGQQRELTRRRERDVFDGAGWGAADLELDRWWRLAFCNNASLVDLTTDPGAQRLAFAFRTLGASCNFTGMLSACPAPTGASGDRVTYVLESEGDGFACSAIAEGGNTMTLTPGGELLLGGIYDGEIFSGSYLLQTGDGVWHDFFGRLALSAGDLGVVESIDLGSSGLFEPKGALRTPLLLDDGTDDVLITTTPYVLPVAAGRFAPPATPPNSFDIMVSRLSSDPARRWARFYGSGGLDWPGRLTRSPGGELVVAGRTTGASALGVCEDPLGCAFWATVSPSDGALSNVLLLDAADTDDPDLTMTAAFETAYAGWAMPGKEYLIAGSANGVVTTEAGSLPAPPECHRSLYFARLSQP